MKRNKLTAIRCILIIITLMMCTLIFSLSADTADESSAKSDPIADSLMIGILENFKLTDEQIATISNTAISFIRKTAHFAEYALLGSLLSAVCTSFYKSKAFTLIISQFCGTLYAVSDEIHQYFVPGRSCQLKDMLIDSCGVLFGILFLFLVIYLYFKIRKVKPTAV